MTTAAIGHNSAVLGQDLRANLETILGEDSDHLFIYAQWHIGDYIVGTQGMSLEHEGAYQRFLMRLYARGKPLPDDDSIMAAIMSLSTRVWRRIKAALVEAGKIVVRGGCLTNKRFEQERLKRAEQLRKRSLAAQARWQMERENRAEIRVAAVPVSSKFEPSFAETGNAEPRVSPKFAGSLPEVSPKLSENVAKKINEINDDTGKSAYANQYPITKRSKEGDAPPCAGAREAEINNPPKWAMDAIFPAEKKAQEDVGWTAGGGVTVMNGFKAALLRDFPRVQLTAALAVVTGEQLPAKDRTSATQLKGAIIRRFGFMEQDEAGRERRAASARHAMTASGRPPQPQQNADDPLYCPPGTPDCIWQNRLAQLVGERRVTRERAIAAGWRPQ